MRARTHTLPSKSRAGGAPPSRATLAAWLAGDAGVTPDGTGVYAAAWADQSGNGRHVTQPTAGQQPQISSTNGRASLKFDGTDDYLVSATFGVALAQPNTLYAVALPAGAATTMVVDGVGSSRHVLGQVAGSKPYASAGTDLIGTAGALTAAQHLLCGVYAGAQGALYLDDMATAHLAGAIGAQACGRLSIGVTSSLLSQFWLGWICEILLYTGAHDATTRAAVKAYLRPRWGLT